MQRHVSPIAKQRISDFFTQEDGNVGRKNALTAGTILSGAMLAAALFAPEFANAGPEDCVNSYFWCGPDDKGVCCSIGWNCCSDWVWVGHEKVYDYFCENGDCPHQDGG